MGTPGTVSQMYRAFVGIFVDSCALYTTITVLFLGSWVGRYSSVYLSFPVLAVIEVSAILSPLPHTVTLGQNIDHKNEQVMSPFLLILRIANGTTLKINPISTGDVASAARFSESQGQSTFDSPTFRDHDQHPTSPMGAFGMDVNRPGVDAENVIEEVPL